MIGIIGAMDLEMQALKARLEEPREERLSGVCFTRGRLLGKETVLAVCGIGKTFAALCAEAMILRYAPSEVINIGVAGALDGRLFVGDMAVGSAAVCHDMDTSALGDPPGMISGLDLVELPLDSQMNSRFLKICREMGVRALSGVIASGDQFVHDGEKKRYIRDTFGAIACEMEGQAIAQVCYVNRTPCAILRSISDGAGGAMDYECFKELAAEHSVRVLCAYLENTE